MRQFFKYVLATLTGLVLFGVVAFILLVGFIAAAASAGKDITVAKNSVLEVKLDKPLAERSTDNPLAAVMGEQSALGLDEVKAAIRRAKTDDDIKGIFLNLEMVQGGMASLQEIRDELVAFRKGGKFVVSYADAQSEKSYYLASVADKLYLNPQGTLEINGLSSETMYYKNMFDKLGVQAQIFRVGSFKSAVEPFFRTSMSDSARLQTSSFLNSLNNAMLAEVAASRRIAPARLKVISDSMLVHNADDAKRLQLVTDLGYYDQATDFIKGKLGLEKDEKLSLVSLGNYVKADDDDDETSSTNRIAVVYAEGDIVTGKGGNESIGSTRFAEAIRKARLDKNVKAVVLRVNSPGGSSLASDIIYREVMLTKKVKPVIASMSDVAASGGYFIAMGCDTIVAHPTTITGSIGVFGVLPNVGPFLSDKLGITTDRVTTGKFSDFPTITRALSPFEQQQFQKEVERIYADFTTKAAQGRHMPVERLRGFASGRVWSGIEAKERGLVDVLGSFDDALRIAARRAKLQEGDYRIQKLPRQKTFAENLLSSFGEEARLRMVKAEMGPLFPVYQQYQQLSQMKGVQMRAPFVLNVQ